MGWPLRSLATSRRAQHVRRETNAYAQWWYDQETEYDFCCLSSCPAYHHDSKGNFEILNPVNTIGSQRWINWRNVDQQMRNCDPLHRPQIGQVRIGRISEFCVGLDGICGILPQGEGVLTSMNI